MIKTPQEGIDWCEREIVHAYKMAEEARRDGRMDDYNYYNGKAAGFFRARDCFRDMRQHERERA